MDREKDYQHEANILIGKYFFDISKIVLSAFVVGEVMLIASNGWFELKDVIILLFGIFASVMLAYTGKTYIKK